MGRALVTFVDVAKREQDFTDRLGAARSTRMKNEYTRNTRTYQLLLKRVLHAFWLPFIFCDIYSVS